MNNKNDHKNINREKIIKNKEPFSKIDAPMKNSVLGIGITNETEKNILEYIVEIIENSQKNIYIVTPNPEMVMSAKKNNEFQAALDQAEIALCDGAGLYVAAKILGTPLKERVTGVDIVEKLCEKVSNQPITVGFLGAGPRVADKAAKCLQEKYFTLDVVYVSEEWDENSVSSMKKKKNTRSIHNTKYMIHDTIDILFVAFGHPKQELWMQQHLNKIPVRVMMGVGGAFDYISGNVPRAPRFLRSIGLEWLYRLVRQPWRWKRQLALVEFAGMVVKEKFNRKKLWN